MPIQSEFPGVSIDILREIFEFASTSSAETGLRLTLVSTYVRHWTLPVIYRNAVLSSSRAVRLFLETMVTSRASSLAPIVPLCSRVKNLGIFALGPLPSIEKIIPLCNIESLACGFSLHAYLLSHHQMPSHVAREVHFLGLSCRDGIPFYLISPETTHFHAQLSLQDFPSIAEIHHYGSAITHLAISTPLSSKKAVEVVGSVTSALLDSRSPLEVLLIQVMGSKAFEIAEAINARNKARTAIANDRVDYRLVATRAPSSIVQQWEKTAVSSADLWEDAEREARQRRARRSVL
ncbi:uncharacterized protein BT62DRAFT_957518 [Guyanagaster necrorhizus]|uniref:Uncharacterized protein n=1 Tax=Guyanagaster necrorhizus TaxID=856835 RepID=A0A9P8ALQ5_9AGAR|nr:uncharacterized protein BT62DRAFT_957518 [Guyanagaster necrorhizus MCA 3950]KAG7440045.1 hypothetical protein BT62DRAFT_957518 [Guyanagaster necrorhizus MCA 3950]